MNTTPRVFSAGAAVTAIGMAAAMAWIGVHRTSAAVRAWRPGSGMVTRSRGLASRVVAPPAAEGERLRDGDGLVIVLLSGLAASERYWGAEFDRLAERATVVAIDPLGFGASLAVDPHGDPSDPATQVRMIDTCLAERGLLGRPLVVVGHSMGASLAVRWAAGAESVRAVVCFGAPLYRSDAEATERMRHLGWFESILARGPLAERVCHWMCRHREGAQWLAVAARPAMPTPIARDGVLHTWRGYIGAFTALIVDPGWEPALAQLSARGIPVELIYGNDDGVPVPGRAQALAAESESTSARTVPGGHDVPLVHPATCVDVIEAACDRVLGAS